jgi:hypothetical protein
MKLYLRSKTHYLHLYHNALVWILDSYDRVNLKKTTRPCMMGSDEVNSLMKYTREMSEDEIAKILLLEI